MCAHMAWDTCDIGKDDKSEAACITVVKKERI